MDDQQTRKEELKAFLRFLNKKTDLFDAVLVQMMLRDSTAPDGELKNKNVLKLEEQDIDELADEYLRVQAMRAKWIEVA